jgi:DNA polymerase III epsilon subunit-like protein
VTLLLALIFIVVVGAFAIAASNNRRVREQTTTNPASLATKPARAPMLPVPRRVLAVDVETTGLELHDRIVSLGIILIDMDAFTGARQLALRFNHLIFNPGRPVILKPGVSTATLMHCCAVRKDLLTTSTHFTN